MLAFLSYKNMEYSHVFDHDLVKNKQQSKTFELVSHCFYWYI